MNFSDVFKSNFLESAIEFSVLDLVISFSIAIILALFIYLVYKKTYTGVMYSSAFGVSLVGMALITNFIILAVTSNIILSLGMVGALSIVRFRTAIKEPMDIVFLFWAISVGIVVGAGLIPLAVIGTVIIGVILFLFANKKSNETPYILVVNSNDDSKEESIMTIIKNESKKLILKAKTANSVGSELTVEIRLKDKTEQLIKNIMSVDGVTNVALVSFNGDYMA